MVPASMIEELDSLRR